MDKHKIKDLKERLDKESNQEHKNKMLYMWIKQDYISLHEYNTLVKESDSSPIVSTRAYDPNFGEVDCEHYELEQGTEDNDELCHKGIGIENCNHCIFNKALHGC